MFETYRRGLPRTVSKSVSRCIYKGPALITGLSVSGTAATPDAQVLDGENSNGEIKIDLRVIQDESFSPNLGEGIFCERGIYVAVDASTTLLTVVYQPVQYKEAGE